MTSQADPFISIIIPVRNDPQNLQSCLDAVFASTYDAFECIVIDDNSTDETSEVISDYPVVSLRNERTRGPAFSRNSGAKLARGEVLFFIDADVRIYPETVALVAREFISSEIDALMGSYDDRPADSSFISQYKNLFHHFVHQNLSATVSTFWSGCGAIRKECFLRLNGFNVKFRRPAIEDIELGMRLFKQGGRIVLKPAIQATHLKRWTFLNMLKTDIFDRGIPWTLLILQRRTLPNNLNISSSQRLYVALSFLIFGCSMATPFAAPFQTQIAFTAMLALTVLISCNHKFYRFFAKKRGKTFALRVVPLHLLYFLYCGVSFGLGILVFYKDKLVGKPVQTHERDSIKLIHQERA